MASLAPPRLGPVAHPTLYATPVAGQGVQELAFLLQGGQRRCPGGPAVTIALLGGPLFLKTGKEMPPLVGHRARIALILCLHLLDVGGVGALQERGLRKGFVFWLGGHGLRRSLGWRKWAAKSHTHVTERLRGRRLPTTLLHIVHAAGRF